MVPDNFCTLILTHGRPDRVATYKTLKRSGYTGPIYFVLDNEDKTVAEYQKRYGKSVVVFDKENEIQRTVDMADNFNGPKSVILFARNASFDIVKSLGYRYFWMLDDDYTFFAYRCDSQLNYCFRGIKSLDDVLCALLDFYKETNACTIALAQGGDYIGGEDSGFSELALHRKAMNSFFCDTERRFNFIGRINEDVNAYVRYGEIGKLFFTVPNVSLNQITTQKAKGGMTETYLSSGTYVKSFYTVLFSPSCVRISEMRTVNKRIHHQIQWDNCTPKILHEKHKKTLQSLPIA